MAHGPIPNSYWLVERTVCCGEYPGNKSESATRAKLGLLLDGGIRSFLDLTEVEDGLKPYEALLREEASRRNIGVTWERFAIRDASVPSRTQMIRILEYLDEQAAAMPGVYVHCWGGVGRTGTVAGCHLIRSGRSGAEALEIVADRWELMSAEKRRRHGGSPETEEQRRFVLGWREEAAS